VALSRPELRGTTGAFASRLSGAHVTRTNALESLVTASWVRGLSVRDAEVAWPGQEILAPRLAPRQPWSDPKWGWKNIKEGT
jgi:hypothetical protein